MYVAVKGGEQAIANAHRLLAEERRGRWEITELSVEQIEQQLGRAVDRVMAEGSLHDRQLAALALKQAQGDVVEAIFLVRAYRNTLPRFGVSLPLDPAQALALRRISSAFKDLPGGQVLGPTFDYTHRLLDFSLLSPLGPTRGPVYTGAPVPLRDEPMPRVADLLAGEGLIERAESRPSGGEPRDLTRQPLSLPAGRDLRLQTLARADEGFLLGLAYSVQRGFGATGHPFLAELRVGEVPVSLVFEGLGFAVEIGSVTVTECVTLHRFDGSATQSPGFLQGYGLVFGKNERKAIAMAILDRSLRARERGEAVDHPGQDEEFVLYHGDNVEAAGFVEHLKLPHYVDFQTELLQLRERRSGDGEAGPGPGDPATDADREKAAEAPDCALQDWNHVVQKDHSIS